ncbi:hypothetical protein [Arthrobacter sp. HLT1-21]
MPSTEQANGLDGLVEGLRTLGSNPIIEDGLLSFTVKATAGPWAGSLIESGIGLEETASWPLIPPHWVHLPDSVEFGHTNAQPSSKTGWIKHSRNIVGWGDAPNSAQCWLSHVRAVLVDAK